MARVLSGPSMNCRDGPRIRTQRAARYVPATYTTNGSLRSHKTKTQSAARDTLPHFADSARRSLRSRRPRSNLPRQFVASEDAPSRRAGSVLLSNVSLKNLLKSRWRGLNPRPADYESAALPLSYNGAIGCNISEDKKVIVRFIRAPKGLTRPRFTAPRRGACYSFPSTLFAC